MSPIKPSSSSRKKFVIIAVFLLAAGAGYYYYNGPMAPSQQGFGMPVDVAKVTATPLDVTLSTVGNLRSNESLIIRPEVAGRIAEIEFQEGTLVKKGEILLSIDDRVYAAQLKEAEASLRLNKLNQGRAGKLRKSGAVAQMTLDQANAEAAVAQAKVELAKTQLEKTRIIAPFDGIVGLRKVSPGDVVEAGQEIASFESSDPVKLDFNIPETHAAAIKTGQQVDITVDAVPGKNFTGTVYAIDPRLDVNGRNLSVRATIPNPDYELRPGYFARVNLIVARKENALFVPESAIVPQGTDSFVYVVTAENKADLRKITIGIRKKGEVEILEGLVEGDTVVTAGQIKLHPGAAVTVMPPAEAGKPS